MAQYCIKWFLVFSLTMLATAIILEDIVTEYAGWVMWLWVASIADIVLQKPIASIWNSSKK